MTYATLDEVRGDQLDPATYSDGDVTTGLARAEAAIDRYCRTSFEYKAATGYAVGNGTRSARLTTIEGWPILFVRSIVAARIDEVSTPTAGWKFTRLGRVTRPDTDDSFPDGDPIEVDVTAGLTAACPVDVAELAVALARAYVRVENNRIDPRAISIQGDYGTVMMAVAQTHPDRAFSIPEVTARLHEYRQFGVAFG